MKVGSISDDKVKAVYADLGERVMTDHRKGRKLSRVKQLSWNDKRVIGR